MGFSGGLVVKNPSANAGDARDMGSIPGSGTFPGVIPHSTILAWKIPWTEDTTEHTHPHTMDIYLLIYLYGDTHIHTQYILIHIWTYIYMYTYT